MNAARLAKYAGALMALEICSACGGSGVAPSSAGLKVGYVGRMLTVNGRPITAARRARCLVTRRSSRSSMNRTRESEDV